MKELKCPPTNRIINTHRISIKFNMLSSSLSWFINYGDDRKVQGTNWDNLQPYPNADKMAATFDD